MSDYPKDWEEVELTNIANTFIGLVTTMTSNYTNDGAKLIRNQDIQNNKFIFKENIYLNRKFAELNKSRMHKLGDVVTVHTGDIGTSAVIEESLVGSLGFATIVTRLDKKIADPYFISCYFNSKYYKDYVMSIMTGDGRNNLNMKDFNKTRLMLPPLPEQKAIADTLMTFDKHIENLEKLIEKKKMVRDGAVEDLMTGKTRLDGFDGEWEEIDFSNYFTKLGNNTLSRDKLCKTGKVSNIHYGDVLIKYGPVLDNVNDVPKIKENVKFDKRYLLKCNDVIFADTAEDETVGKAVQIGKIHEPIVSGLHTIPCRPNYRTANRFMGYYVNSKIFHDQLLPHITGIKVSSISKKSIDSTKLNIPTDIKEQQAIASILTSMDEEIQDLEKEKEKIEKIKAGAMDDLLTGRVRLI